MIVYEDEEDEINETMQKVNKNGKFFLSEMEMQEVHRHARTFGFIPDFKGIRYNCQKLRRMRVKHLKKKNPEMLEQIYLQEQKVQEMENMSIYNQGHL